MFSEMILLNYEEYERLKAYEQKYLVLKEKMHAEEKRKQSEQSGQGKTQDLDKIILENENENSNGTQSQEIIAPITTPADIEDVSDIKERGPPKPKKQKKEGEKKVPSNWWYLGVPKYKK